MLHKIQTGYRPRLTAPDRALLAQTSSIQSLPGLRLRHICRSWERIPPATPLIGQVMMADFLNPFGRCLQSHPPVHSNNCRLSFPARSRWWEVQTLFRHLVANSGLFSEIADGR